MAPPRLAKALPSTGGALRCLAELMATTSGIWFASSETFCAGVRGIFWNYLWESFVALFQEQNSRPNDDLAILPQCWFSLFTFKTESVFFTNTLTVLLCYPRQDPAKPSALTQSPSSVALFTAVSKAWKVPGWGLLKCWLSAASADVAPGSNIRILWCLGGNPGLACTGQAVLLLQKFVLKPPGLARIDPQIIFDFEGEKLDMLKYQSRATTMLEATRKRLRTTRGTQSNHRNNRNIFPTETDPNFQHCHPSMKVVDLNGDIVQNCMQFHSGTIVSCSEYPEWTNFVVGWCLIFWPYLSTQAVPSLQGGEAFVCLASRSGQGSSVCLSMPIPDKKSNKNHDPLVWPNICYVMIDQNSWIRERLFFAKKNISRIFRKLHVYLSRGHVEQQLLLLRFSHHLPNHTKSSQITFFKAL